jgi:hypothetical protein
MGTIAKWLVLRVAAAAQADTGAPGKSERLALWIHDFEVAFNADIAIAIDGDFRRGHSISGPQVTAQCIIAEESRKCEPAQFGWRPQSMAAFM